MDFAFDATTLELRERLLSAESLDLLSLLHVEFLVDREPDPSLAHVPLDPAQVERFAREVKARVNEYFEKTGCRGTQMGR